MMPKKIEAFEVEGQLYRTEKEALNALKHKRFAVLRELAGNLNCYLHNLSFIDAEKLNLVASSLHALQCETDRISSLIGVEDSAGE